MRSDFEPFGWVFEWPFGSESRGKQRRRRSWFGAGDLKYVILEMLAEKPMHGYEVMNALEARTKGCYRPSPGSVYPTLQWLEDEGLVRIEVTEGKKVYHVTEVGRAFLVEHRSTVDEIFDRVADTIKRAVREPMPEVSKAMGRVVKQAYRTAWKSDQGARRVVEVLDRVTAELDEVT